MINWLIEQQWSLSLVLAAILLASRFFISFCGATFIYRLWLLVPLVLIINNLPTPITEVVDTPLQQYVVTIAHQAQQFNHGELLFSLWLFGCLLMLGVIVIEHYAITSRLAQGDNKHYLTPTRLPASLNSAAASPILIGIFKARLVLPLHFETNFSPEQQQLILAHENIHFERRDNWANVAAIGFVTLFWFNPLVWLAYRQFRKNQEMSCDERVLRHCNQTQKINYCKAMLKTAMHNQHGLYSYSYYMEKSTMKQRMQYIQTMPKGNALIKTLLAVTLIGGLSSVAFAQYSEQDSVKKLKAKHNVHPIVRIEPEYPKHAAEENIEGSVVLSFNVDKNGATKNIKVIASEPQGVFDRSAKKALAQWQYTSSNDSTHQHLVQLDFAMSENFQPKQLVERIKVSK